MTGEPDSKVCKLCAETIKATAKVCPHCRHFQKLWSLQNPLMLASIYSVVLVIVLMGIMIFFESAFESKQDFATYRNEITVVSSQFSQRISGSNLWVTVVGVLTNRSDVGWKDVGVEAQFFDKAGKMIDAITVNADDYHGVTILPHGETAFKVEGKASHPAADYETNKLTVRWAKDAANWYP